MKNISTADDCLVLRTDYSNKAAWHLLCSDIKRLIGEFQAYIEVLSNSDYENLTPEADNSIDT